MIMIMEIIDNDEELNLVGGFFWSETDYYIYFIV